jgi:group II intron reverse transcriptase/maturase
MSSLHRIRKTAKANRTLRFNNLLHHITPELLQNAYDNLNKKAARGIDGETWHSYGQGLADKLQSLHRNIHTGRYKPQPSKRIWLLKSDGRQRPIGIAVVEDKIVQQALVWVIQSIYEEDFLGFSYGFRPKRHQHKALDALYVALTEKRVNWVIDADIKGFFDNIDHNWMIKFLAHRISDKRILSLVEKMLKAGVSDEGSWSASEMGSAQGSVLSPLLANIYLFYALDLWINKWRQQEASGEIYIVRYADDFVICCEYQQDARRLLAELNERLKQFNLTLHEEKTRLLEFGRYAKKNRARQGKSKPETFTFLGFTHICSQLLSNGRYTVKRLTIAKKQRAKLKQIKECLYKNKHVNLVEQGKWLRSVVTGFANYYGVPGNTKSLSNFRGQICKLWMKALRRRSGKAQKLTWLKMKRITRFFLPSLRLTHPYPNQRFYV